MVSSLSRAAVGVRVLSLLYLLFTCFLFLDVAVASRDVTPRAQPQPPRLRSPLPSRAREPLQRAVIRRQENGNGDRPTPPPNSSFKADGVGQTVSTSSAAAAVPTPTASLPFTIPASIILNQVATIGVPWPTDPGVSMMVLCQTSATDVSLMTSDNTWAVLKVDFGCECTLETLLAEFITSEACYNRFL
jgi:hypothetical protein